MQATGPAQSLPPTQGARAVSPDMPTLHMGLEPPASFRPIQPPKSYPIAPSHSPPCSPALSPVMAAIPAPTCCAPIPFGDRFEAVRTPATQTLVLSLEEYFLHHCPEKLTNIYDPEEFARQLLERGPKVEVPVWMPQEVPIQVQGHHTVQEEIQEIPYFVDVDVFEEEEVIRVVEEVHEHLVEVPCERVIEQVIEVEEVEFRFVPIDRVVEVVQERIRETPVVRPIELVKEKLVVCPNEVPVVLVRERAEPVPVEHLVNMVVDRVETRVVEVPYERVVTKYVEVLFEKVIEQRSDALIEKIIEVEREDVTKKVVERRVPVEIVVEKQVFKPVEKVTERLIRIPPKTVINEFEFTPPSLSLVDDARPSDEYAAPVQEWSNGAQRYGSWSQGAHPEAQWAAPPRPSYPSSQPEAQHPSYADYRSTPSGGYTTYPPPSSTYTKSVQPAAPPPRRVGPGGDRGAAPPPRRSIPEAPAKAPKAKPQGKRTG